MRGSVYLSEQEDKLSACEQRAIWRVISHAEWEAETWGRFHFWLTCTRLNESDEQNNN